jgi:hypothetical protein
MRRFHEWLLLSLIRVGHTSLKLLRPDTGGAVYSESGSSSHAATPASDVQQAFDFLLRTIVRSAVRDGVLAVVNDANANRLTVIITGLGTR